MPAYAAISSTSIRPSTSTSFLPWLRTRVGVRVGAAGQGRGEGEGGGCGPPQKTTDWFTTFFCLTTVSIRVDPPPVDA